MEKYTRVPKQKESKEQIQENEIRITSTGKTRSYITYATTIFNENKNDCITLKAMGRAINKSVSIAEIIKRRVVGLHQTTEVHSQPIIDIWEPNEEGLKRLETKRTVSAITIVLSKKELDTKHTGYQTPLPEEEVKPREQEKQEQEQQNQDQKDDNSGKDKSRRNRGGRGGRGGRGRRRPRRGRFGRGGYQGSRRDEFQVGGEKNENENDNENENENENGNDNENNGDTYVSGSSRGGRGGRGGRGRGGRGRGGRGGRRGRGGRGGNGYRRNYENRGRNYENRGGNYESKGENFDNRGGRGRNRGPRGGRGFRGRGRGRGRGGQQFQQQQQLE